MIPATKQARNSLRQKLWNSEKFAHMWMVHYSHGQTVCPDGCDQAGEPKAVAFYQSEIET